MNHKVLKYGKKYIPDIIWINCDPSASNEHKGHRPAIVISPISYNKLTNLCIFYPMTTKIKEYPFAVVVEIVLY